MSNIPFDIDAETCTLGALILSQGECYHDIRKIVSADDFYRPAHSIIFRAIASILAANQSLDLVSLAGCLRDIGKIEAVGGPNYLGELVDGTPSSYNWEYYAKRMRDKAVLRLVISEASKMKNEASVSGAVAEDVLASWQQAAFSYQPATASKSLSESTLTVLRESATKGHGLSLSIPEIDFMTGGMRPGNVMILAAYTSCGKTTLALNIMAWLCQRSVPVYYVTREMGTDELVQRVMANVGSVNGVKMRMGTANDNEMRALDAAKQEIDKWPMVVDEEASTVADIAVGVRRMALTGKKPGLAIIDYLQLLHGKGTTFRERFSNISTEIKTLARQTKVPFLVLSQFARPQKGSLSHPTIFDLKETGSLENDADYILLLNQGEKEDEILAAMPKNRHGPALRWPDEGGALWFKWTKEYLRMEPAGAYQ